MCACIGFQIILIIYIRNFADTVYFLKFKFEKKTHAYLN